MKKALNIIFIMTDQLRADHVGYAKNSRIETPNIDRIAEGTVFQNCVTVNPICMPARTALLTGKYPRQIGTLNMSGDMDLDHPTYLQALQKAGYSTATIGKLHWFQGWPWKTPVGKGHNLVKQKEEIKKFGIDYLWEASGKQLCCKNYCDYAKQLDDKGILTAYREHIVKDKEVFPTHLQTDSEFEPWVFPFEDEDYIDIATTNKALEYLDQDFENPFYLYFSLSGPHPPYDPPQSYLDKVELEEFEERTIFSEQLSEVQKKTAAHLTRSYHAMINVIDDQIGRLFEKLEEKGILDNTVILFSSDHGEMLGDRIKSNKNLPYNSSVHVPGAVRHPDHLEHAEVVGPVELTDFTATILDIAGIEVEEALSKPWPAFHDRIPSKSLMPIVSGEEDSVREFAFSEASNLWQMIQSDRYKYIRNLNNEDPDVLHEEFYDRLKDPDELNNLIGSEELSDDIAWHRRRRDFVLDKYPPAQTQWMELIG